MQRRFRRSYVALSGTLLLATCLLGQDAAPEKKFPSPPANRIPVQAPKPGKMAAALSPKAITGAMIAEVLAQNVTIAPGASQTFNSVSDFTGVSSRVNIGIYAPNDQDLTNTAYYFLWGVPNAPSFVVTDYLAGKNLQYTNSGSYSWYPFGNQFQLQVANNGQKAITISTITIYAVAR